MLLLLLRYGESEGYAERVLLIYDGLHYDAMAVAAFEGAPEELDITVLQVGVGRIALCKFVFHRRAACLLAGWLAYWLAGWLALVLLRLPKQSKL